MLVLTRKPGEQIVIDEQITVTVLELQGNRIRLGIEAPKEVPIERKELVRSMVAALARQRDLDSRKCLGSA
jgi:carbon storage regulator